MCMQYSSVIAAVRHAWLEVVLASPHGHQYKALALESECTPVYVVLAMCLQHTTGCETTPVLLGKITSASSLFRRYNRDLNALQWGW